MLDHHASPIFGRRLLVELADLIRTDGQGGNDTHSTAFAFRALRRMSWSQRRVCLAAACPIRQVLSAVLSAPYPMCPSRLRRVRFRQRHTHVSHGEMLRQMLAVGRRQASDPFPAFDQLLQRERGTE